MFFYFGRSSVKYKFNWYSFKAKGIYSEVMVDIMLLKMSQLTMSLACCLSRDWASSPPKLKHIATIYFKIGWT